MTRTAEQSTNCRCVPCDFGCNEGKWYIDGQEMDCFGCDGSGIDTRCDEHKEKNDDE